ncbi:MAG TPA: ABC transporter ATP-binding protein [Kineosporiaceae bacterium]|nr:ABC transporter ATP-binding protein [Kineosporiaceae bacterium]
MTTQATPDPLLQLRDLRLDLLGDDGGDRPILRGVDLTVQAGEAVGIVGESGSGKSMTLRCIARLTPPGARVSGDVLVGGRDVNRYRGGQLRRFRQTEVGYVFQDPRAAINPMHTVGDFLLEPARDRGEDLGAATAAAVETLTRMGITDPQRRMRQYPFELSGGLLQRVMIASVLLARPSLLLADEPTTALDVTTQAEVLALTDRLRRDSGIAMLFVTHDLDLAIAVCSRIVVLYAGQVLEVADSESLRRAPLHPYTRGLLASRPPLDQRLPRIPVIPGTPVSAADSGPGCPFAGRCPVALPVCASAFPDRTVHPGGQVACHRAGEIAAGSLDDALPVIPHQPSGPGAAEDPLQPGGSGIPVPAATDAGEQL